jgi:hypothetical protein
MNEVSYDFALKYRQPIRGFKDPKITKDLFLPDHKLKPIRETLQRNPYSPKDFNRSGSSSSSISSSSLAIVYKLFYMKLSVYNTHQLHLH